MNVLQLGYIRVLHGSELLESGPTLSCFTLAPLTIIIFTLQFIHSKGVASCFDFVQIWLSELLTLSTLLYVSKQFCSPRAGNPGNVLLTKGDPLKTNAFSSNRQKYFYQ